MNNIFITILLLISFNSFGQNILPNTVKCYSGDGVTPFSSCADSEACKNIDGSIICLANTMSPPIGAIVSTQTCWTLVKEYTCLQYVSDCTRYSSDSLCTEIGAKACTKDGNGQPMIATIPGIGECSSYTRNFSCTDSRKPTQDSYTQTTECDISGLMGGVDWTVTTKSSADDFVVAATGQEFARQIAIYGAKDAGGINNLFPGLASSCRDGYAGLKNCCKSSGGGTISNNSLAKGIGISVALGGFKQGSGYAVAKGSKYVFDTIYTGVQPMFFGPGMASMLSDGMGNSWQSAGFGAFGFGTTAAAAEGLTGGLFYQSTIEFSVGSQTLYFNPYALATAIAIQLVMEAMSCTQDEQDLARARAESLCHYVGDFCSNEIKFLGATIGCLETTQAYCCYNGLLGKAIAEGGRAQIGKGWGSPKGPDCSGFTPAQLSSIDFNTPGMQSALEPFKQSIMSNFNSTAAPALAGGSIKTSIGGRVGDNSKALCLQRKTLDPTTVCQ